MTMTRKAIDGMLRVAVVPLHNVTLFADTMSSDALPVASSVLTVTSCALEGGVY